MRAVSTDTTAVSRGKTGKRRSSAVMLVMCVALIAAGLVALPASADLTNSNFEIDADANLRVDGAAPSTDWVAVAENRQADQPSGQMDNSFGQGTKEDSATPTVVAGSIPPNKSDLVAFGVYQEEGAGGKFLHLYWTRVQEPSGTTNMDFEFNQSETLSANGVTPVRTIGDLLVVYELSRGGTVPELFLFTWLGSAADGLCEAANSYPCWGERTDLSSSGAATGSINASAIPDGESDIGAFDPRTFGEATIDLDFIFDDTKCQSFGSAYLKSRSSDSFTAALKDFIAPQPVNITNCGQVIIRKQTDPDGTAGSFGFTTTLVTDPASGGSAFSLADDGVETISNVLFGTGYTVTEDDPSAAGFDLSAIDCSASVGVVPTVDLTSRQVTFDIDDAADVADCTFTNRARGTIIVEKQTDPDGAAGDFTFSGDVSGTLQDDGQLTVTDLAPGTYTATEADPTPAFDLTSISCDDLNSAGDVETRTATFELEAGETVTCTFTNRARGSILIEKIVQGTTDRLDGAAFHYDSDGDGSVDTVVPEVGTGLFCVDQLVPGNYLVEETPPAGFLGSDPQTLEAVAGSGLCSARVLAGDEPDATFTNEAQPMITTEFEETVTVGEDIQDTAILANGYFPTGTITFNLYSDAACANLVTTDSATVNGNGSYGVTYTTDTVGTFYWVASYGGDASNAAASGSCGDAGEIDVVEPASPTLVTTPRLLPNDEATLTGGFGTLGGTIMFELHDTGDCTGTALYSQTVPVVGAGSYNTTNTTVFITADGTYSWEVTYSGDANNNSAASTCTAERYVIDITPDPVAP